MSFRNIVLYLIAAVAAFSALTALPGAAQTPRELDVDIAIYGATPSGISAALAAARLGSTVALTERHDHIGGLMTNGLGASDIKVRGAIGGHFLEFVQSVRNYYSTTYGPDSVQLKDANDGYYFEPRVAELIFNNKLEAEPNITVLTNLELTAVNKRGNRVTGLELRDRQTGAGVAVRAKVTLDATYEGDLAAMAGVPYRVGREAREEYGEPYAGVLYWGYRNKIYFDELSTGKGDDRIQAYNFRLPLTDDPENRVMVEKPDNYDPNEYRILQRQIWAGEVKNFKEVVHIVPMPNRKSDTNNHTIPLLSTDLPEENYPYPEASWEWREAFTKRLRDYTLGLIYFCQNDYALPEEFREDASRWGLAADEYVDNGNFPRQMYVREARRIWGEHNFIAQDALVPPGGHRTPVQSDSIGCGSYEIDSHATRKYEPGIPVLEGLLGVWQYSKPYQIPYGVIVPQRVDGLLVTGAISGTHMGFSTLRMEPTWMAMGQAGGTAAHLAVEQDRQPRRVDVRELQRQLLADNAVIMYFQDVEFSEPRRKALEYFGSHGGIFETYTSDYNVPIQRYQAAQWLDLARRMGIWGASRRHDGFDFVDVGRDHLAWREIQGLVERGLFREEVREGEFRPLESLTPNQLARWFEEAGVDVEIPASVGNAWVRRGDFLMMLYNLEERK